MRYFKFYIQQEGIDSSGNNYPIKEAGVDFLVYEQSSKFYGGMETKEPAKRDWYDQDGDDEFIPKNPKYKAKEIEVKFACKGALFSSNKKIDNFQAFLANCGSMKIYDEYNGVGRQNVRFVSVSDDAELHRKMDGSDEALVFTVKMKVNDPVTKITPLKDENGNVISLIVTQ